MHVVKDTLIFREDDDAINAENHPDFYSSGLRKIIKLETDEGFCLRAAVGHCLIMDEGFSKKIDDLKKGDKIQIFNKNMNIPINMNSILMNTTKIKEYQILFLQNKKFMVYDYINNFLYEKRNSDFYATVKYVFPDGIAETFTTNMFENFYTNGFLSCNIINE